MKNKNLRKKKKSKIDILISLLWKLTIIGTIIGTISSENIIFPKFPTIVICYFIITGLWLWLLIQQEMTMAYPDFMYKIFNNSIFQLCVLLIFYITIYGLIILTKGD